MKNVAIALVVAACACALFAPATALAAVRTHYIAADEVLWNYAPSGRDLIAGSALPPLAPQQMGWKFHKIIYREYTDASFTTLAPRRAADAYMGLLGPPIHAAVGDTVDILFKNHAPIPTNVAFAATPRRHVAPVPPGGIAHYSWHITSEEGPGPSDGSSIAWRYFSTCDEISDENTGMVGPLIVTRAGEANADGSPRDVDREAFVLFSEMDESLSRLAHANLADPSINPNRVRPTPPFTGPYTFANQIYNINGFVFGNMPLFSIRDGSRVRWYVVVTGSDFDAHTPHWHGQTVLYRGMRTDIIDAQVNQIQVVDMVPDNPGIWLMHCHVELHLAGGMEARFAVVR